VARALNMSTDIMSSTSSWLARVVLVIAACNGSGSQPRPDTEVDAPHRPSDAGLDAAIDGSFPDGSVLPGDAAVDAAADGAVDAAADAAADAAIDAPAAGQFRTVGALAQVRQSAAAALLLDGRVLIVGGDTPELGDAWLTSAEVFLPATGTFAPVGSTADAHRAPTATTLLDGRVLVTGPVTITGGLAYRTELFDPASNTVSPGPDMLVAESGLPTLLADGRVLFTGEENQLYDPASNTFRPAPQLTVLGPGHRALRLAGGRVLLTGGPHQGSSGGGTRYDAEELDPATTTFVATGRMATARGGHRMATLPGGRALVTGGYIGLGGAVEVYESAEIYDPVARAFSTTGTMTTSRNGHTATALADGRVLVAGGSSDGMGQAPDNTFEVVASAELFDPATGTFTATSSMAVARRGHTATRLLDGRVLVIGGAPTAVAELYTP
jgi:hypothetical protein